jgi:transcriptional regulator with XRE-family HTH domain
MGKCTLCKLITKRVELNCPLCEGNGMHCTNFAYALSHLLHELDFTQREFAEKIGVSQSMITKLMKGEPGKLETYQKVFGWFRDDFKEDHGQPERRLGIALLEAYLKDTISALELLDDEFDRLGLVPTLRTESDNSIQNMFGQFSPVVLLALYTIGIHSKSDKGHNVLMGLAELMSEGTSPPTGFFSQHVRKPDTPRAVGGSMGELMLRLSSKNRGKKGA